MEKTANTKNNLLTIKNLFVSIHSEKDSYVNVLKGINLEIKSGELHILMGPNGAGKTTLALGLMGNSKYKLETKNLKFKINQKDLFKLKPEERAKEGLFVSFQNPTEIPGVPYFSFLRTAYKSLYLDKRNSMESFKKEIDILIKDLSICKNLNSRFVNTGFSGGEKKIAELFQMFLFKPKFAVLDEIDSGLDLDNLKKITRIIRKAIKKYNIGIIFITHNPRIFNYLRPDYVHILNNGKIKTSGGIELLKRIEKESYAKL